MLFRARPIVLSLAVMSAVAAIPAVSTIGCSNEEKASTKWTGGEIVQGLLGVGPAADRFGDQGTLEQRLQNTKNALKNRAVTAEKLGAFFTDLKAKPGDPLPPPRLASQKPSDDEIDKILLPALDQAKLPTAAQYEGMVQKVIEEIEIRSPGYLDKFGVEMQSGDPGRVSRAMDVMMRTLVTIFESVGLGKHLAGDPVLGPALDEQFGISSVRAQAIKTQEFCVSAGACSPSDPSCAENSPFDPIVVPNQLPNDANTWAIDQYWGATRVAAGAYVGAAVVVAAGVAVAVLVWAAAVKGVGPFIPLANAQEQNPGDQLSREMQIANLTAALAAR